MVKRHLPLPNYCHRQMAPPARTAAHAGDEKAGQESAQTLRQETEQAHKLLRDAKTLRRASLISIDSENEHKLVEVNGCSSVKANTTFDFFSNM